MRIHDFWKLRKQNDAVKIWCVFVCIAVFCLVRAGYYGWESYQKVNRPIEYQVMGAADGTGQSKWVGISNLLAVSDGLTDEMSIRYQGKEISVSYQALSKDYMQTVYGITCEDGEKCFYLNEAAYQQLADAFMEQEVSLAGLQDGADQSIELQYCQMQDEEEGTVTYRTAKFVVIKDGWISDEPQIDTVLQGAQTGDYQMVAYSKGDLTDTQRSQIAKAGGTVGDEALILQREYEIKEMILRVQYELVVAVITGAAAMLLWHYGIRQRL